LLDSETPFPQKYGIPQAVYCDRKNAFVSNREPTVEERLAGVDPKSHFEKACEKLGIQVMAAHSPQAKGRVERNHAACQDRFVKELRLAGMSTIEEACQFLTKTYIPQINAKFERKAACPDDAHVPLMNASLREIMCFEENRVTVISRVMFKTRLFQILPGKQRRPRPGDKVTVRVRLDNSLDIYFNGVKLAIQEIAKTMRKKEAALSSSLCQGTFLSGLDTLVFCPNQFEYAVLVLSIQ
jgi:hypothetical protein